MAIIEHDVMYISYLILCEIRAWIRSMHQNNIYMSDIEHCPFQNKQHWTYRNSLENYIWTMASLTRIPKVIKELVSTVICRYIVVFVTGQMFCISWNSWAMKFIRNFRAQSINSQEHSLYRLHVMNDLEQVKEKAVGNGIKEVLVWVEKKQVCNEMKFFYLRVSF